MAFITKYLEQQKVQKRYVLVVVSIALFVEQMLYMVSKCFIFNRIKRYIFKIRQVVVPIIPKYLREIHANNVCFADKWKNGEQIQNRHKC